jgi:hypothetical protein
MWVGGSCGSIVNAAICTSGVAFKGYRRLEDTCKKKGDLVQRS